MANVKEHHIAEARLHPSFLEDGIQALLNTLLFVRAPSLLKAKDRTCESLSPLIYATCGLVEVDQNINAILELFKTSLQQSLYASSGRSSYRAEIVVSFYDKREIKEWIGLVTRTERVYFERWHIPISVPLANTTTTSSSSTPGGGGGGGGGEMDVATAYRIAYDCVTKGMMSIIETVNNATDHVPLTTYEFEIQVVDAPSPQQSPSNSNKAHSSKKVSSTPGGGFSSSR